MILTKTSSKEDVHRNALHVLLVEDDEDDAESIVRHIRSKTESEVHSQRVDTEADMIKALQNQRWDVVLCDYRLSHLTFKRAVDLIKQHYKQRYVPPPPIILLSGKISMEKGASLIRDAVQDYIVKDDLSRLVPVMIRELKNYLVKEDRLRLIVKKSHSEGYLNALTQVIPGVVFQGVAQKDGGVEITYASRPPISQPGSQVLRRLPRLPEGRLENLFVAEDVGKFRSLLKSCKNGVVDWEGYAGYADLGKRRIRVRTTMTEVPGQQPLADGIVIDITEFHQNKQELQELQRKLAAQNAKLYDSLEKERGRIANDLHDDFGSNLVAVKMYASLITQYVSDPELLDLAGGIEKITEGLLLKIHEIVKDLRPGILREFGLTTSLDALVDEFSRRSGIRCVFTKPQLDHQLKESCELVIYRIVQECLTNVAKHARATKVHIRIYFTKMYLKMRIHDNGIGIRPRDLDKPNSYGYRSMEERVGLLSGSLQVTATQPHGTLVRVQLDRTLMRRTNRGK